MYRILLSVDSSEHSTKTVSEAINRAALPDTEVTALYVIEYMSFWDSFALAREFKHVDSYDAQVVDNKLKEMDETMEQGAEKILRQVSEKFKNKGLEVNTLWKKGRPADVICREANSGYDLLIMGNKGFTVLNLLLGSVASEVLQRVETSVLIVK